MARTTSASGLPEMWIPPDVTADLAKLLADHLMVYGVFPLFWTGELGCQMVDVPES
jgi:hypothetical protein